MNTKPRVGAFVGIAFALMAPYFAFMGTSTKKTKRATWIMRTWGSYLVLVWSVLFLIGVKGTIEGKYALSRVIPAGAFLLFFIGIFGWNIYRTFQGKI
jgi:hypothetical protein